MSGPKKPETPLLILAGGKGTRLQAFDPTRPKPMVLVSGKPFLHWLVDHYVREGFSDFVISTGHMAEVIESYEWSRQFANARFRFERELQPLGTGGAVKLIFEKQSLESAWVINGDTLLEAPLPATDRQFEAFYTVLSGENVFDATPNLHVQGELITNVAENGQFFDGGAVFVTQKAVNRFKGAVPCSLHQVLLPAMAAGKVGYSVVSGTCYDIGTPDRYRRFERFLLESSRNV